MWKEIKGNGLIVRYHKNEDPESDLVNTIIIKNLNTDTEIIVNFKIQQNEPYDLLVVKNNKLNYHVVFELEQNPDTTDPFFTYADYFEKINAEEAAEDIKKYIISLVSDILELS